MKVLTDPPIKSKSDDKLGRSPLADRVANMLITYEGTESFVVGIEGEWGSGKTSFIQLVCESLNKSRPNKRPDIIFFNPWNFSNKDTLYLEFFNLLGEKTESKSAIKYAKKLFNALDKVEFEPNFLGVSFGKVGLDLNNTAANYRKELEKHLIDRKKKVVIILDDIDRLDKKETREIFKLVKVNANFPNVIYLLAYDRPKVEQILNESGFPGAEYLKKIVQVSFSIPNPESDQFYQILFEEIDRILESDENKEVTSKLWDNKRWGNLFHSGFKNLFRTIRDIKRYISSWQLGYLAVGYPEVNPVDFLGIEAIRVFAPSVYSEIANNKELFTATESLYVGSGRSDDRDRKKSIIEGIFKKSPEGIEENIKEICFQLFPQIKSLFSNEHYGHDWQAGWRRDLRICSTDIFDIYFRLSVPSTKISQTEFDSIIKTSTNPNKFLTNIQKITPAQKLRSFLGKIMDSMEKFNKEQKIILFHSFMLAGDIIEDEQQGMFDVEDAESMTRRISYHLLKNLELKDQILCFKKALLGKSLYTPLYLFGYIVKENEDLEAKKSEDIPLISDKNALESLRELAVKKLERSIDTGKLNQHKHLGALLIWWSKWDPKNIKLRKYITNLLENKTGTITLLRAFKVTMHTQSLGDYVSTRKHRLDTKSLFNLAGQKEVQGAIKKFLNDKSLLNSEEKELLALYQEAVSGKED